jgi:hypothetical protein
MSNWRAVVDEALQPENTRNIRNASSDSAPSVASVPSVLPLDPRATLRDWHRHLSALDFDTAPEGSTLNRWRQLVEDAEYIYTGFGSQLVREGWSVLDVFGVLPWREGGGVLLDRLQGARNLKLDGEGRAFWTRFGVTFSTSRGMGDALASSGLRLVWELGQ